MPELPEVETVRLGLNKLIVGKTIASVEHDWPKSFPNAESAVATFLVGAKITAIRRRAKVLLIDLNTGYSLVIHLKMTGQMVYVQSHESRVMSHEQKSLKSQTIEPKAKGSETLTSNYQLPTTTHEVRFGAGHPNNSLIGALPDKSTRVTFIFNDETKLFFNDQRKFGWVKLIPTSEIPNIEFFKKVGPEPLSAEFTQESFRQRLLRRPNTNIKVALLDQTVIAGVGNIYADESLWGAKLHPSTLVKSISVAKMNTLYTELRYVLNLAIEKGGSSDRNYINAEGKKGSYLSFARVFRRENQPCPRCLTTIVKTRVASRGTHTCPKCQRLTK